MQFDEQPTAEGVVSGGFFVFQREVLNYLDDDPDLLEQRPPPYLARDGQLRLTSMRVSGIPWTPTATFPRSQ